MTLIGKKIKHSLSPQIHNHWLSKYRIPALYDLMPTDDLTQSIIKLREQHYLGANITAPYKLQVISFLDTIDEIAQKVQAVNTIVKKGKHLHGTNTDARGFIDNFKNKYPLYDFKTSKTLILGSGGVARAIIYALQSQEIDKIYLACRTVRHIQSILTNNITVISWHEKDKYLSKCNMLINATPLGTDGENDLEIKMHNLAKESLVADVVYSPVITGLLRRAMECNFKILNGLGMLLYQAAYAFEHWCNITPVIEEEFFTNILHNQCR